MKTFFMQRLSQFAVLESFRRVGFSSGEIRNIKKALKKLKGNKYDLMQDSDNPTIIYIAPFNAPLGAKALAYVDKRHYGFIYLQADFDNNYEEIRKAYENDQRNK